MVTSSVVKHFSLELLIYVNTRLWINYSLAPFSKLLNITISSSAKMVFICCGLTGFQLKTVNQDMFINSSAMHGRFFGSSFAQSNFFFTTPLGLLTKICWPWSFFSYKQTFQLLALQANWLRHFTKKYTANKNFSGDLLQLHCPFTLVACIFAGKWYCRKDKLSQHL